VRYFVVTYVKKTDGKYDEVIKVAEKLTTKMVRSANIILDFRDRKVEKARLEEPIQRDWFILKNYYENIYTDIITTLERTYPPEPDASNS